METCEGPTAKALEQVHCAMRQMRKIRKRNGVREAPATKVYLGHGTKRVNFLIVFQSTCFKPYTPAMTTAKRVCLSLVAFVLPACQRNALQLSHHQPLLTVCHTHSLFSIRHSPFREYSTWLVKSNKPSFSYQMINLHAERKLESSNSRFPNAKMRQGLL